MKRTGLLVIALVFIFSSCQKDPASNAKKVTTNTNGPALNYNDSYRAWVSYKSNVSNSYSYITTTSSFTGRSIEIKTSVINGSIISRDYTAFQYEQNSANKTIIKQWHEDQSILNTHPDDVGDAITMDAVYLQAKSIWLKADPKTNDIYFETKNNGLISTCGYFPLGCQDDCFTGINISSITSL